MSTPDPAETTATLPAAEETMAMPVVPEPEGNPPGSGYFSGVGEGNVTWHPGEYRPGTFQGTSVAGQPDPAPRPFPYIPIGDALISSLPGFDIPPCGHCGEVFTDATPDVLAAVRPLLELRHLAYQAGWGYDLGLTWTCPECAGAMAQAAAEADVLLAGGSYPDILREFDIAARATMTNRHSWDYDGWRERFRPRPEFCEPEAPEASAA
jgi:hypothetical protein